MVTSNPPSPARRDAGRRVLYGDVRREREAETGAERESSDATAVREAAPAARGADTSIIVPTLFLITLCLPIIIQLGSIRLSPYRILLILMFAPMLARLYSGKAGKVRIYDHLILLAFVWGAATLFKNHGFGGGLEPAGILLIEGFGAYLVARVYIRNAAQFEAVMGRIVLIIILMYPFSLYETMTGNPLLIKVISLFANTLHNVNQAPRLGLERVQGVFEHSIHFGVFCAITIGYIHYIALRKQSITVAAPKFMVVVTSVFLSLSSGAMGAAFMQFVFIAWDRLTKSIPNRWRLLGVLFGIFYVTIDLLSNRTPVQVLVTTITFNASSSYNRILIWRYGTQNVADNPIWGLGMNEWVHPSWMSSSADNFWLLLTMRHGLPFLILFGLGVLLILRTVAKRAIDDEDVSACRSAFLVSFIAMSAAGSIVHFWNALFVLFMFLLGSGAWLADMGGDARTAQKLPRRRG